MNFRLAILLILISAICRAQSAMERVMNIIKDPGFDSSYIDSFKGDLTLTLVGQSTNNDIILKNVLRDEITFATNVPFTYGLALDYRWLSLEFTSSLGRTPDNNKGFTLLRNFGFGITMRKFLFRNFYQSSQGYYLTNPGYFNPDFNPSTDIYPHRDDLRSSVYYATLNYVFNYKTFSSLAALWQLERQKKSAGTFVTGLTYSYATYQADSSLVPPEYQYLFLGNNNINTLFFNLYGANFGYMHTFVLAKNYRFFLSLGIIPGISYQHATAYYDKNLGKGSNSDLGIHAEGRMVAGYNADNWYTAISVVGYTLSGRIQDVNPYNQGFSWVRFVVGYRFKMFEHNSEQLKKIGL